MPETRGRTSASRVGAMRPGNSLVMGSSSWLTVTTFTALAAFAATANRHQLARGLRQRIEIGPFPDMGDGLGPRVARHQIAKLRPERV